MPTIDQGIATNHLNTKKPDQYTTSNGNLDAVVDMSVAPEAVSLKLSVEAIQMLQRMAQVPPEKRLRSEDPRIQVILDQIYENDPKVSKLDISSRGITDKELSLILKALETNTNITSLKASQNQIGPLGAEALAKNKTIAFLDVSDNHIRSKGVIALAQNNAITDLNVRFNNIDDEGAEALSENKTITDLNIDTNRVSKTLVAKLALKTKANKDQMEEITSTILKEFVLRDNERLFLERNREAVVNYMKQKCSDKGYEHKVNNRFRTLDRNEILKELDIIMTPPDPKIQKILAQIYEDYSTSTVSELDISREYPHDNQALKTRPRITSLDISHQNLTDNQLILILEALKSNPHITSLDISSNQIGPDGAKALAENKTITHLKAAFNNMGDVGLKELAKNNTITSLHVSFNKVSAVGVTALAKNNTITHLDVSYCGVGDEGAVALAKNNTITHLNVSNSEIGDSGARAIAENTSITSLNLLWNNIGPDGASALAENNTITDLNIDNNRVDETLVTKLAFKTKLNQERMEKITSSILEKRELDENEQPFFILHVEAVVNYMKQKCSDKSYEEKVRSRFGTIDRNDILKKINIIRSPDPKIQRILYQIYKNDPKVSELDISRQGITDQELYQILEALKRNPHITSLKASQNSIGPDGAAALAKTNAITDLNVSGNKIGEVGAKALAESDTITSLNISWNGLDQEVLNALSLKISANKERMEKITSSILENRELDRNEQIFFVMNGKAVVNYMKHKCSDKKYEDKVRSRFGTIDKNEILKKLEINDLGVSGRFFVNKVSAQAAEQQLRVAVPQEKRLTSADPKIQRILDEIYENDPKVSRLFLYDKGITDDQFGLILEALNTNLHITNLKIQNYKIGDTGAIALARNTTITHLDVSNNNIGHVGAAALARNTTITHLDVSNNNIEHVGAAALAGNTTITHLDVSNNNIGHVGAAALAGNRTITNLNLKSNEIGDAGAIAIAGNTTITHLDVSYCGIGDKGAMALASNTTLTYLCAQNNNIGDEGAKAFTKNNNITVLRIEVNHRLVREHIEQITRELVKEKIRANKDYAEQMEKVTSSILQNHELENVEYLFLKEYTKAVVNYMILECSKSYKYKAKVHDRFKTLDRNEIFKQIDIDILHADGRFFEATGVVKEGLFNHDIDAIVASFLRPSAVKNPKPGIKDRSATTPKVAPTTPGRSPGSTIGRGV